MIYEGIHPKLLTWLVVREALVWKNAQQPGDENLIVQLRKAEDQVFKLEAKHKIWKPKRKSKLLIIPRSGRDLDMIATPDPP